MADAMEADKSTRVGPVTRSAIFGIVGGYGATGSAVASELHKSCDAEIVIGGRDLGKGKAFAEKFVNRVSAVRLDVFDERELEDFCSRCSIVVNCGGPVTLLQDRVAQAAFRARCHYVDVAGMSVVREPISAHDREATDQGLSFVVSAGWMPGLTELLPSYAHAQAKARMGAVDNITVYFGDSGNWSDNALRDAIWYLRRLGLRSPGYFHQGEWLRMKISAAFPRVDLGSEVCAGRFSMSSTAELDQLGRQLKDCDFFTYAYVSSMGNAISASLLLLPVPESLGLRLLRSVFRRNRMAVGGFVVVRAGGPVQGGQQTLVVRLTFESGLDYWINGLVAATVARMISEGRVVRAGVNFLADAVDPAALIAEVRKVGIKLDVTWGS